MHGASFDSRYPIPPKTRDTFLEPKRTRRTGLSGRRRNNDSDCSTDRCDRGIHRDPAGGMPHGLRVQPGRERLPARSRSGRNRVGQSHNVDPARARSIPLIRERWTLDGKETQTKELPEPEADAIPDPEGGRRVREEERRAEVLRPEAEARQVVGHRSQGLRSAKES